MASPYYATWSSSLNNNAVSSGGIARLSIDGRDLTAGGARICFSNGYYRPVVPWGGSSGGNEGRCP
jgi:hypothetical protein